MNVKHIFHGEINQNGKAVGFHHRGAIGHQGRARVVQITKPLNTQGVYEAEVEIYDSASRRWITKPTPSTFFPNSWYRAQVVDEIGGAFKNRIFTSGEKWRGISPSGLTIEGYLDNAGNITTAYPLYE